MDSSSQADLENPRSSWSLLTVILLGAALTLIILAFAVTLIARVNRSLTHARARAHANANCANNTGLVGGFNGNNKNNLDHGNNTLINKAFNEGQDQNMDSAVQMRYAHLMAGNTKTGGGSGITRIDKSPDLIPQFNGKQSLSKVKVTVFVYFFSNFSKNYFIAITISSCWLSATTTFIHWHKRNTKIFCGKFENEYIFFWNTVCTPVDKCANPTEVHLKGSGKIMKTF